jgi:hypothetical protein
MADSERRGGGDRPAQREPRPGEPDGLAGGADAVEKTTYAGDARGADVEGRQVPSTGVTASVKSGGGLGPLGWGALFLALLAFAAYAAGLLR